MAQKIFITNEELVINELKDVFEIINKPQFLRFLRNDIHGISVEDQRDIKIDRDTDTTTLPYKIFSFYDNQSNFIKLNVYDETKEIIASKLFILPKIIYPYFKKKIEILNKLKLMINLLDNFKLKSIFLSEDTITEKIKNLESDFIALQDLYIKIEENSHQSSIKTNEPEPEDGPQLEGEDTMENQQGREHIYKQVIELLNTYNLKIIQDIHSEQTINDDQLDEFILMLDRNNDVVSRRNNYSDIRGYYENNKDELLTIINLIIDLKKTQEITELISDVTSIHPSYNITSIVDFIEDINYYQYSLNLKKINDLKVKLIDIENSFFTNNTENNTPTLEMTIEINGEYKRKSLSSEKKAKTKKTKIKTKISEKTNKKKLPVLKELSTKIINILDSIEDLELIIENLDEISEKVIILLEEETPEQWTIELLKKKKEDQIKQIITLYVVKDNSIEYYSKSKKERKWLSTFFKANPFQFNDFTFSTVEHAYHSQKMDNSDPKYKDYAQQFTEDITPEEAKALGSKKTFDENELELRPDWDEVRLQLMEDISRAYYMANSKMKKKLIDTGDKVLLHKGPRIDSFWGIKKDGGFNHHGKILMKLRNEFKSLTGGFVNIEESLQNYKNSTIKFPIDNPSDNSFFYSIIEYLKQNNMLEKYKLSKLVNFKNVSSDNEVIYQPVNNLAVYQFRKLIGNLLLQYQNYSDLIDIKELILQKYEDINKYIEKLMSCEVILITDIEIHLTCFILKTNILITNNRLKQSYGSYDSQPIELLKINEKYFYLSKNKFKKTLYEKIDVKLLALTIKSIDYQVAYTNDECIKIIGIYKNKKIEKIKDKNISSEICGLFGKYYELDILNDNNDNLNFWKDIVTNKLITIQDKVDFCNDFAGNLTITGHINNSGIIKCC